MITRIRTYISLKFFLLKIIVLLLYFSCNEPQSDTNLELSSIKDSTFILIQQGRNTDLSISERREFIAEAHKRVKKTTNDSLRTKYLSRLSLAYSKINDSFNFRKTNKETIVLGTKVNDFIAVAEAHWDMAIFFSNASIKDSSYYHYAKAQRLFQNAGDEASSGQMLLNLASVQRDVKDYTGSEITTIKAIEIFKKLGNNEQLYNCYNDLGIISNNLGEYNEALKNHQEALSYLEKLEVKNKFLPLTLNNIGVVYQEQGNHHKAIPYFEEVIASDSLFLKKPNLYAQALDNLAYNKFKNGDTSNVKIQLIRASNIRDSINNIREFSTSNYNLAEYYAFNKDTVTALKYAEIAKKTSLKSRNYKRLLRTLQLLTHLNPRNATNYSQQYISLNDSLQLAERRVRNKFARIEFETNEVKEKNALLAKQQQLWIGISIGLLVLALFIVLAIYQRIRNQKLRFEQQQQASNQEIFDLMLNQKEQIQEGKQAEQKRISEELHDGIVGQMAGIRLMFIGLNKRKDEESVERREGLIKKLQETEEEIRTISHELNHASYQKIHNFINSIQELLDSTGSVAEIENNFYYNQETDWDDLSSEIKINLYRIVQESLQNCVKYAKASNILVDFDTNENMIKIVISDNGVGFDTKKGKKGIGLKNIQSRVKKLNGTWEISSTIGEGTRTIIEIPRNVDEMISDYPLKKVL